MKEQICKIMCISDVSYYRWKKERPIISFLENYFTKEDLEDYLENEKVKKLELIKNYSYDQLYNLINSSSIKDTQFYLSNILFKIERLDIKELRILNYAIKTNLPISKPDLLNSIYLIEFNKKTLSKIKLDIEEFKLIDYINAKESLMRFIEIYISNEEVSAYIKNL